MLMGVWALCMWGTRVDAISANPFPAFFIFGDSLVDVGNNNYIVSVARANNLPFGIDFPKGPTGRFCNGKTVLDVIGMPPSPAKVVDLLT